MVLGYHVVFSCYGFWLPNDPRGSWSDYVGAWELYRFGPATKIDTRASVAHAKHHVQLRREAKAALKYPAVSFTGRQALAVGTGFGKYVARNGIDVWACSILPEHVHLVIARHTFDVEYVVNQLKGWATRQLRSDAIHPAAPACWERGLWKVFLNDDTAIARAIAYVENNPVKEGKPRQRWNFIAPFSRAP